MMLGDGARAGTALPRAQSIAVFSALALLSAAAWVVTSWEAGSMAAMGAPALVGAGVFLATWVVMMVAMMFPSVAPITQAFAAVSRLRGQGMAPTAVFVLGYLAVWTLAGLVPLGAGALAGRISLAPDASLRLGGIVIALAAAYQLSPLKNACLTECRSPLGFIMNHDFGRGARAAVRAGVEHGVYCLGCCGGLMAVLAVLGLMNVAWMALFALVFALEKNWRHGVALSWAAGVVFLCTGVAIAVL